MHSGNHEIIGIRHRKTQTLYISHVIEPHSCFNPAYGKIQVGIYIAAVQETIDRTMQDKEAKEKNPPADISLKAEEANSDADPDDHSPEEQTEPEKWSRGSGSIRGKSRRQGGHEGNAKRHASGKVIDDQVCILYLLALLSHSCS